MNMLCYTIMPSLKETQKAQAEIEWKEQIERYVLSRTLRTPTPGHRAIATTTATTTTTATATRRHRRRRRYQRKYAPVPSTTTALGTHPTWSHSDPVCPLPKGAQGAGQEES